MQGLSPLRQSLLIGIVGLVFLNVSGCIFSGKAKTPVIGGNTRRGFFAITSPGSSPPVNMHTNLEISWKYLDSLPVPLVALHLYQKDSLATILVRQTENRGSFTANLLGQHIASGTDYRIKIMDAADTGVWDMGKKFSVYSGYTGKISTQSPLSDMAIPLATNTTIIWTITGSIVQGGVGLQLYKGGDLVSNIISRISAASSYSWHVASPLGAGENYSIWVYSYDDPLIRSQSGYFSIVSR